MSDEEMHLARVVNRRSVQTYYRRNASSIVAHKTRRLICERGRVPRESTLAKCKIDKAWVLEQLLAFQKQYPDSRASRKIAKFVHEQDMCDVPCSV